MSLWDMLGKIIIGPLELLLDVIYTFAYEFTRTPGMAIVVLSLTVNLLILPLYLRADRIQEEDKDQQARMKPGIDRIKKAFKGDEQYMILQTYYRQNHYKPYYALKSLLPLLLQVPFFMAAYNYLSNLNLLYTATFGPIRDLGAPDALLRIGSLTINVLPVAMTVINLLSGMVYSKGMPLKSKVQMLVIALVFLALLYNSPSGLVFYWTLNNVFSLVKNLFMKLKNYKTILKGLCSAAGIALIALFLFIRPINDSVRRSILVAAAALLELPAFSALLKKLKVLPASFRGIPDTKTTKAIFWCSCAFLALLTGCMIPLAVLKASPSEFVNILHYRNPLWYIVHSFLIAAGTFLLWMPVYYGLSSGKMKGTLALVFAALALISVINYSAFGGNYGDMSDIIQYDDPIKVSSNDILIGLCIIPAVAAAVFLIIRKAPGLLLAICLTGCIAAGAVCAADTAQIQARAAEMRASSEKTADAMPEIHLSKTGKNTVVIMLDRALGSLVPYIMNEKPELQEKFDGFTLYPNTVSYGPFTNICTPSLFGGYEYTPDMLNARTEELLPDKQNEALRVMPVMFEEAGYDVTVFDPPYANYNSKSDVSIYSDYPDIHGYIALGRFMDNQEEREAVMDALRERNFFCYGIFRASSPAFHGVLYNNGEYNSKKIYSYVINNGAFLKGYWLLKNLPAITEVKDEYEKGCFFMMATEMTHGGELLQEPDYVPSTSVDNRAYEAEHGIRTTADGRELDLTSASPLIQKHYHANMAAYLLLADWMDYLRENGVYDNTKIILVADHGYYLNMFGFDLREKYSELPPNAYYHGDFWTDTMAYMPLLMVKDFNAKGFSEDYTFMTNADTPTLAVKDVIENPVNPATGKPINNDDKTNGDIRLMVSTCYTEINRGYVFTNQIHLRLSNQDIYNIDNWTIEDAKLREAGK